MSDWVEEPGESEVWWYRYRVVLGVSLLGLIFLIWGVILLRWPGVTSQGSEYVTADRAAEGAGESEGVWVVQVAGAVLAPGVYELPPGSRVNDGLILAGGLAGDADRKYVAKNINLAAKIQDGQKIYIPAVGEGDAAVKGVQTGTISVNSASASELESLTGVGPKMAEKIISNRPYATLDELVIKKAMGKKLYESLAGQLRL